MAQRKYVSLTRLSNFLDNIKAKYSQIGHKHTTADLTDYEVDTSLSSTSNNPVANKVLNEEFDAIATAMNVFEQAIDDKADAFHTHSISNVTNLQTSLDTKVPTSRNINGKALTTDITLSASDVDAYSKIEIDSMEFITVDDIDAICV